MIFTIRIMHFSEWQMTNRTKQEWNQEHQLGSFSFNQEEMLVCANLEAMDMDRYRWTGDIFFKNRISKKC